MAGTTKRAKTSADATLGRVSYAAAVSAVRIAVLPKGYPSVTLSAEQLSALEEAILEEAIVSETEVELRFNGIRFKPGFILVECATPRVAEWLKAAATKLRTWQGPELTACTGEEIPKLYSVGVFLPKSPGWTAEKMLGLPQKQNREVNTNLWRVMKTKPEGNGQMLSISIDERSADVIRSSGHTLQYRFGAVSVLGLRRVAKAAGPEADGIPSDTSARTSTGGENPVGSIPNAEGCIRMEVEPASPQVVEKAIAPVGTDSGMDNVHRDQLPTTSKEAVRAINEPVASAVSDEEDLLGNLTLASTGSIPSDDETLQNTVLEVDEAMLLEEGSPPNE